MRRRDLTEEELRERRARRRTTARTIALGLLRLATSIIDLVRERRNPRDRP